jgi:MinD superfamily P-loop ATPase
MEKKINVPGFDSSKCNNCGLCIGVCACRSFVFIEKVVRMNETTNCDCCQQCEMVCPTGAITFSFEVVEE